MNYVDLVKFNLSGICFSCLSSDRKMYSSKRIMNCFNMIANIDIPEGVMVKVCWECMAYIDNVFRFKGTVERSYHILTDYFMKNRAFDRPNDITACGQARLQCKSCEPVDFPPQLDWSMEHDIKREQDEDIGSDLSLDPGPLKKCFFEEDPTAREDVANLENSEQTIEEFGVSLVSAEGLQGETINPLTSVEESGMDKAKISPNTKKNYGHDHRGKEFLQGFRLFKQQVQANKRFSCDICSYITNYKGNLKMHMRSHTGEKPFSCNTCSYKCKARAVLNQHMQIHTGNYSFSCKLCPYKCIQKARLKVHMLTHTGEKPFSCELCSYKSLWRSNLNKHMRTHTGEKRFICEICSAGFTKNDGLHLHLRTHTGEKPFSCGICSLRFNAKTNLRSHMQTHTDEKRFGCELCSYRSKRRYGLKEHMRTHEPKKDQRQFKLN